jgi:L-ribulokinase
VGDALAWVAATTRSSHAELAASAAALPPGAGGVMALDWLNGCRTPLMDGRLSGGFVGLTLGTTPGQLYRAMIEATALGLRWVVDTLRAGGVPVTRFLASGGLPAKAPLLMQLYADVLGAPIDVAGGGEPVARGAAMLGAVAGGAHAGLPAAVRAMSEGRSLSQQGCGGDVDAAAAVVGRGRAVSGQDQAARRWQPQTGHTAAYDRLYGLYRALAHAAAGEQSLGDRLSTTVAGGGAGGAAASGAGDVSRATAPMPLAQVLRELRQLAYDAAGSAATQPGVAP